MSTDQPAKKKHINYKLRHYGLINAYPTQISKIFDPTDEETAISPNPFRATMTDVIKSGIEVPAAKNVRPMTYQLAKVVLDLCYIRGDASSKGLSESSFQ